MALPVGFYGSLQWIGWLSLLDEVALNHWNTHYLKDPIEKDDYMIHEGRIVYGKNLVVLDPQRSFITIRETFRSGDLVMNFETGEFFRNEEKLNLSYIE